MTSLIATASFSVVDDINSVKEINYHKYRQRRHVLKSKENTIRHRCDKVLKRKLRKYKLRQDGQEDQDILDVSKILVSSLIIRSPNNRKDPYLCEDSELDDWRPKNYLFKMVRRKPVKISESLKNSNTEVDVQDDVTRDSPSAVTSQEKKQTNAFKLLMDSRNKSLGCNSPGKDKSDENIDTTEVIERKNMKAKRQLLLQKMAEAKGSLKNKEIEEFQDNIIKDQLEKRAKRLKSMIFKDTKSDKEGKSSNGKLKKDEIIDLSIEDKAKVADNNNTKKQTKSNTFKIVDIFNTVEENTIITPVKKHISKEDEDFLNKLSPSLKKKESMLCYFKKIDKDTECSPTNSENDNLIKVKLQPRSKKKSKKKKLSLKKDSLEVCDLTETIKEQEENINEEVSEILVDNNEKITDNKVHESSIKTQQKSEDKTLASISVNIPDFTTDNKILNVNGDGVKVKNDSQKRKRNSKLDTKLDSENTNITCNSESRPKRSVKRPVKYVDDACLSSSDEDLHIFTPKKKKHIESKNDKKPVCSKTDQPLDELKPVKPKAEKKIEKVLKDVTCKKPTKLAPIFTSKQTDPAALEAKQKFLQSGVPDKLKKQIQQQKVCSIPDNSFPVVVHVQQSTAILEDNQFVNIPLMITETEEDYTLSYENNKMQKLLNLNQDLSCHSVDTISKKSTQAMLQSIKKLHPKFPVYRTYRYLRSKGKGEFKDCSYVDVDNSIEVLGDMVDVINDSPDRLNWTDKYKAITTKQIIGNFETLKELRKWLVSWTENQVKSKAKSKANSDSSDYYESEPDSRDSMKSTNNLLILAGPTGCGKTASIYAVAADLAMKVIEVNASSRRTGKIMLQDLQEATQSHKVNRGTGNSDNSQKSQEKQTVIPKQTKKRGRPKKAIEEEKSKASVVKNEVLSGTTLSQESTRTDSSLILIDDADIVFDQDDGFTSAIVQLVHCSKRPVILITSSLVCPHLQRFVQNAKILKMSPLLPRILGTWLDIMCLADSGMCWPGVGAKMLNYFKGDIRKTINYLQFCLPKVQSVASEEEAASQNVDFYKNHIDEESSCMSWADNDDTEGKTSAAGDVDINTIWTAFASKHSNLMNLTCPVQLFNMWWSMPSLLTTTPTDRPSQKCNISHKKKASLELEAIANAADAFSLSDYYSHINPDTDRNITSQPWYCPESHSVSERENPGYYHKEHEVMSEICHTILTGSIATAQDVLSCDRKTNISFPGMLLNRQKDRVVSRHNSLTSYLNASAVLDRRALALDYWSSCRTICRLEKSKNDTNMKRNNRFCHYLKSLSVLCKSDTFDNLCDSLCSNVGTELNINNFNE
ncbi:ATPase family AAA domain-containing protein 5 [Spodoptera litura]|uniref:ATPase family AAA domain-containing protein 5 n=1 Tax=Spodoptera litura TaxID=69820 RepID=A0A9J7EK60_SPOLT|nr:ATPase family AAA domain-containing protein 5 [Spodoptera litura]